MVNIIFTMWHIWCHSSNIHPKFNQHPCTILQYYNQNFPPNKMEIKSNPMKVQVVTSTSPCGTNNANHPTFIQNSSNILGQPCNLAIL